MARHHDRVHLTGESLWYFEALSTHKWNPALKANPSPARQQETQAVKRLGRHGAERASLFGCQFMV